MVSSVMLEESVQTAVRSSFHTSFIENRCPAPTNYFIFAQFSSYQEQIYLCAARKKRDLFAYPQHAEDRNIQNGNKNYVQTDRRIN